MTKHTSIEEQQFLDDLDKKLWNSADRLRNALDAAVYKHAVLGLIFLKYVSDAFELRRQELAAAFRDPKSDYFLDRSDYKNDAAYAKAIHDELEDRDYFTEKNVFWVPPLARWKTIRENAALAPDTEIEIRNGKVEKYTFRSAARLIDDALEAIEKENPRLKGVIEKNRYMQLQIEPAKLVGLISEVVSSIPFRHASLNAKDILGHVYEYFLGQFALAEGKKGGQYYTPKSIVSVIVEMLEPYSGKVYDPAMGSGGFFVQSEAFIEAQGGKLGAKDLSNFQIKLVWQNAGVELMEAARLVFIGYSLPHADFEFRQLMSRMVRHDASSRMAKESEALPHVIEFLTSHNLPTEPSP